MVISIGRLVMKCPLFLFALFLICALSFFPCTSSKSRSSLNQIIGYPFTSFSQFIPDITGKGNIVGNILKGADRIPRGYTSIRHFGALGDGKSDDYPAIKKGLVLSSKIYFPKGVYRISNTINVTSNKRILLNNSAIILVPPNKICINITGNNSSIAGGDILGNPNNLSGFYGINVLGSHCSIKNIKIYNIKYTAVFNDGVFNKFENVLAQNCGWDCGSNYTHSGWSTWYNCKAIRCYRHGFSTDPESKNIIFKDCQVKDVGGIKTGEGQDAYHIEGTQNCSLINCNAVFTANNSNNTNPYGQLRLFWIENSKNTIIDGLHCTFEKGFKAKDAVCFRIGGSSKNAEIIDSKIVSFSQKVLPVQWAGGFDIRIIKDTFIGNFNSIQESGASFPRMVDECLIDGIDKSSSFLNFIYGMSNCSFTNNIIRDQDIGIKFAYAQNVIFSNNSIIDCNKAIIFTTYKGNANLVPEDVVCYKNIIKNCRIGIQFINGMRSTGNTIKENKFSGSFENVIDLNYSRINIWEKNTISPTTKYRNLTKGKGTIIFEKKSDTIILSDNK